MNESIFFPLSTSILQDHQENKVVSLNLYDLKIRLLKTFIAKRAAVEKLFVDKRQRHSKYIYNERKKEREILEIRIKNRRREKLRRMKRIEKLIKSKGNILSLRKLEEKVIHGELGKHVGECNRRLNKRKRKNGDKNSKAESMLVRLREIRIDKFGQLVRLCSLDSVNSDADFFDFFKVVKLDSPMIFEFDNEDMQMSKKMTKDVYFELKDDEFDSRFFSFEDKRMVIEAFGLMSYHVLRCSFSIFGISSPVVFNEFSIHFLMKRKIQLNLDNKEETSDFVSLLYFSFIYLLKKLNFKIEWIPKLNFKILKKIAEAWETGADISNALELEKLGDYEDLEFPVLAADLVSFTERLDSDRLDVQDRYDSDSDGFIMITDDF